MSGAPYYNFSSGLLEDISERFHNTLEYTSKLIKTLAEGTFTQLHLQIRMEKAQVLLLNTNLSVDNIVNQIDYENSEHFIRTFKKTLKWHLPNTEKSDIIFKNIST